MCTSGPEGALLASLVIGPIQKQTRCLGQLVNSFFGNFMWWLLVSWSTGGNFFWLSRSVQISDLLVLPGYRFVYLSFCLFGCLPVCCSCWCLSVCQLAV